MNEKLKLSWPQDTELEKIKEAVKYVIDNEKNRRWELRLEYGDLKRTPFDSLNEMGILNPDRLVEEWKAIQKRKSSLSSNQRKAVNGIMLTALTNMMYQKAEAAQAENSKSNEPINEKNNDETL